MRYVVLRGAPEFSNADLALIGWLARTALEDSDRVLPFPPEEELRLKRRRGLARLGRKVKAVRRARRPAPPPPY